MRDPIQRALTSLLASLVERPEIAAEYEASLADFAPGRTLPTTEPAWLRHLESFLLERPSDAFDGEVPVLALRADLESGGDLSDVDADALDLVSDSRAGMFVVREVRPGEGFWLKDLLGLGELPVLERRASAELTPGDLVVGRAYADGDGAFVLSPAAEVFSREGLVEALRLDAEQARAGRRGTMRITQRELERMFFEPGARFEDPSAAAGAPDLAELEASAPIVEVESAQVIGARIDAQLRKSGWDDEDRAALVEVMTSAAIEPVKPDVANAAIARALELVAFESDIDLGPLRIDFAAWWAALKLEAVRTAKQLREDGAAAGRAKLAAGFERASAPADESSTGGGLSAQEALAAFDRGRAEGRDVEALFRQLEADLGLEADDEEDDPGDAPDFPGVVGAMVEEYLWDGERQAADSSAEQAEFLRAFAALHTEIGLFDALEAQHLIDFAARAAIENELCATDHERRARALLDALERFARWADAEHELELWIEFEEAHATLVEDLARAAAVSRKLARPVGLDWSAENWARVEAEGREAVRGNERFELLLSAKIDDRELGPREGDWVVGRAKNGRFEAAAVLPRAASRLR
ncbi:hypothetical protein Pla163_21130 [Planctomycetes bacterium Pla163]|uniref:Uncharacterized protein n=1 Tax=Rohdeia mirabilis TaxID=2528008 RepID=A0A518D0J6_9BACT|nr:hypothetical protein Pla163_21130 [Planctomycetes bacterium Pla163]